MDEREKSASKATKITPFQGNGAPTSGQVSHEKHHGRLGSLLHGHRPSSSSHISQQPAQSILPPREPSLLTPASAQGNTGSSLDTVDPSWRETLSELLELGITEDQIEEHAGFIKSYIEQKQANKANEGALDETSNSTNNGRGRGPPPPPPPAAAPGRIKSLSPQNTGSTVSSKRGPPPAPPPARRSRLENHSAPSPPRQPTPPSRSPDRTPSPPAPVLKFKAPPPLADAGKFAGANAPIPPQRQRAVSNLANPGPPPPPRPPKTPVDEEVEPKPRFGVPPPFQGNHAAPPTPNRTPVPPPPPRATRDVSQSHSIPPHTAAPPPLPPKTPNGPVTPSAPLLPPPLPNQRNVPPAPIPPPLPSIARPVPGPPSGGPPPPPPLPSSNAPPPPPLPSSGAPPPPPLPSQGGPPPPPLPPGRDAVSAPPLPKPTGGKEDVLASIRATGGIGGLKKVSEKDKRDRSAAPIPGAVGGTGSGANSKPTSTGGGGGGGMADAIAKALSERNKKVSASGKS